MKLGIFKVLIFSAFTVYSFFGTIGNDFENKTVFNTQQANRVSQVDNFKLESTIDLDNEDLVITYNRINKFRVDSGLPKLKIKGAMVYAARLHSKNMFNADYLYNMPSNKFSKGAFTIVASITAKTLNERDLIDIWKASGYYNRVLSEQYDEDTFMGLGKVGEYYTLVIAREK